MLSKKLSSERHKCAHHVPLNGSLNAAWANFAELVLMYAVSVAYVPSASTFGRPLPSTFIVLLSISLVHGPISAAHLQRKGSRQALCGCPGMCDLNT
ncbi:hypothetical protein BDR06DRAFT_962726 [Suillus hirtellus]|nr:hypothetical protein BDR06DRAFT_962726 [Suillus hirtellus]